MMFYFILCIYHLSICFKIDYLQMKQQHERLIDSPYLFNYIAAMPLKCIYDIRFDYYKIKFSLMESSNHLSGVTSKKTGEISTFFMIYWIFVQYKKIIPEKQALRIQQMYGAAKKVFNPIVTGRENLKILVQKIKQKNPNCVIKVVAQKDHILPVLKYTDKLSQIIEVHQFSPSFNSSIPELNEQLNFQSINIKEQEEVLKLKEKYGKLISHSNNINEYIEKAEKEVEWGTKSFRTFNNSTILTDKQCLETINRYRFRLLAAIQVNLSDLYNQIKLFQKFWTKQIVFLKDHEKKATNVQVEDKLLETIKRYQRKAQIMNKQEVKFARKNIKEKQSDKRKILREQIEKKRQNFYIEVLDIYQSAGFFSNFINNNLRSVCQKHSKNWLYLLLPFFHIYHAIKFFYDRYVQMEMRPNFLGDKMYTIPFTVFRSCRMRRSELKQYEKYQKQGVFIQFFSFLSTSLSIELVVNSFLKNMFSKDSRQSEWEEGDAENSYQDIKVVFQIKCNFDPRITDVQYRLFNHGFYFFDKKNANGDIEKEVLFNALNVFKLVQVRWTTLRQLLDMKAQLKKHSENSSFQDKYKHEEKIVVIELQYGSFHKVLLEENPYNLTESEKAVKKGYVYCMNKINKCEKFDIGNAYEFTNELEESYKYIKKKLRAERKNKGFFICQLDGKNYYQRQSKNCQKMGKVKQGISHIEIAIQCHLQVKQLFFSKMYNEHYEKLFEMQKTIVDILVESCDFLSTLQKLQDNLNQLKSKNFSQPRAKVRESEIYINKAVNNFSVGLVTDCLTNFSTCNQEIRNVLVQIQESQKDTQATIGGYLCNWFCPHPKIGKRICCYCQFQTLLKDQHLKLIQKCGGKQELSKASSLTQNLNLIAMETLGKLLKYFKDQQEYKKMLSRFNENLRVLKVFKKTEKSREEQLVQQIRLSMTRINDLDADMDRFDQEQKNIQKKFDELDELKSTKLTSNTSYNFSAISQTETENLKQKLRQKRIKQLQENKQEILKNSKKHLFKYLSQYADQIKKCISQLQQEGYSTKSLRVLKKMNELAVILERCNQSQETLLAIQNILENSNQGDDVKYYQLAVAYTTKGKILLRTNKINESIDSLDNALNYLEDSTRNPLIKNVSENGSVTFQSVLQQKNLFIEIKILKARALLFRYDEQLQNRSFSPVSPSFSPCRKPELQSYQKTSSEVNELIIQINKIISRRSQNEDLSQLDADAIEVQVLLRLRRHEQERSQPEIVKTTFDLLSKCSKIRDDKMGKYNSVNALMWCHVVQRFHKTQNIFDLIQGSDFQERMVEAQKYFQCYYFYSKIADAITIYNDTKRYNTNVRLQKKQQMNNLKDSFKKILIKKRSSFEPQSSMSTAQLMNQSNSETIVRQENFKGRINLKGRDQRLTVSGRGRYQKEGDKQLEKEERSVSGKKKHNKKPRKKQQSSPRKPAFILEEQEDEQKIEQKNDDSHQ